MNETELRAALLATSRAMAHEGLNRGTAGNASVRCGDGFLVTPSGRPYDACREEDMAWVAMDGSWRGPFAPSSEWRIHRDLLAARPEAGAVLHAHSPFATSLACHNRAIPAFHYMVARFGGADVRCAPYATFGTQALSNAALVALEDRSACLLGHHGMLVLGRDLERTLALAIEFETLCEHYWRACQLGEPPCLPATEMETVLEKFHTYGQARPAGAPDR